MIRALLWKEYREQRTVWLALAFLGAGVPLGLVLVFAPEGWAGHENLWFGLGVMAVVLAWTQGLVSGAILLAGEREERTAIFLDGLPGSRWRVWAGKCLGGLLVVGAQVALLVATGVGVRYFGDGQALALGVLILSVAGLTGFCWGLCFSALTSSALSAILGAFLAQGLAFLLSGCLGFPVAAQLAPLLPEKVAGAVGSSAALLLATVGALVFSGYAFTAEDRRRLAYRLRFADLAEPPPTAEPSGTFWAPWGRAFWLAGRQSRWFGPGLVGFAFLLAFAVLILPPVAWPLASLLLGVLCGVTAFADEQELGSFRFLGEQRLSLAPLWVVKVGLRYLLCCLAVLVALLPLVLTQIPRHPSQGPPLWLPSQVHPADLFLFLCVWPAYGFGVAVLCGLLFRRTLVAGVVALGVGGLLALVWVPSLVAGGVRLWQVLGVPAIALGGSYFLARFWAAGRLASGPGVGLIAGTGVACLLWTAGGIWYRAAEIPDVPEDPELAEFVAGLPRREENEAGGLIRSAASSLLEWRRREWEPAEVGMVAGRPRPATLSERLVEVLEAGWPAGDADLAARLDEVFAGEWDEQLTRAADLPLGVVEDPRHLTFAGYQSGLDECRWAAELLAARGLQRQAEGQPEVFVENLRVGLALSRHLRHKAPLIATLVAEAAEGRLLRGLDRWLEGLHGRPELLRQALGVLIRHGQAIPDVKESFLAEQLIARNALEQPHAWLGLYGQPDRPWELDLIATCWQVPWEAERNRRIVRALNSGEWDRLPTDRLIDTPAGPFLVHSFAPRRWEKDRHAPVSLHAGQLKVALRLYEAEQGRPAEHLGELLEKNYLFSLPTDPFGGGAFGYRVSGGEEIGWPREEGGPGWEDAVVEPGPPVRFVPPGQGILWSTGPDRADDGGNEQGLSRKVPAGTDWIYLVPRPGG